MTKRVGNGEPAAAALDVRGWPGRGPYPRLVFVGLHVAVAAALLGAMIWIQRAYDLERYAESSLQWLRQSWLPIIGVLFYGLAWCGWYLMLTVRTRDDSESNADIRREWKAAKRRMSRAGIDIHRVPLFLTLGQPTGGVHRFFSAGQFNFSVPAIPADDAAPLSVCGNRDAVFVCCNQTSQLGSFSTRPAATAALSALSSAATPGFISGSTSHGMAAVTPVPENTLAAEVIEAMGDHGGPPPGGDARPFSPSPAPSSAAGGVATAALAQSRPTVAAVPLAETVQGMEQRLTELESQLALVDAAPEAEISAACVPAASTSPQLDACATDQVIERLELICRLIAEEREPFCPLNGIVLLVPMQATDSDATAEEAGNRIVQDLQAVIRAVEMEVSVQVVLCDLETCEGAEAWLERCPQENRNRPLGTLLPDALECETDAPAEWSDRAAGWLCDDLLPSLARGGLRRATADRSADRRHQRGNRSVHRFVQSMRARRTHLSRLLRQCVAPQSRPWRVRGCFLAATGSVDSANCAFTAGLMPVIQGMQHEVRWLESRRQRDAWYLAVAIAGYGLMALLAAATIALLVRV